MTEREFATDVVRRLQEAGHVALFAGGCVRDELLGLVPADHDVATDARPERVQALFRRTHAFGASFGVVEVIGPRDARGEWLKVQVATFRSDGTYTDGRRPDAVTFSSPEEDAARRDFTINGLFADPISGRLWDFVGGEADLRAKVLRAIGNPEERFAEDKLRIMRAVRMAARFELTVDPATFAAVKAMAGQIRVVSAERIAEELRKILTHPTAGRGVELLRESGLFAVLFPEVSHTPFLSFTALQNVGMPVSFPLAFAAVLDGVDGKTATAIGRRLRLSNDELDRVAWLVAHRSALDAAATTPNSRLYPLLVHPGIRELIGLHYHRGAVGGPGHCEGLLRDHPRETFNPLPLLTGDDLKAMGLKPGPQFKSWLDRLRALQLDGELTTRSEAEEKIREWSGADSGL